MAARKGFTRIVAAGTYLHGALETPTCWKTGLAFVRREPVSYDDSYNRLADWFERWSDGPMFEKLFLSDRAR